MLELIDLLAAWKPAARGGRCAVATIISTDGSTPRPLGTSMLVHDGGAVLGSLSGGCVEGAVIAAAHEAMETGLARCERFGFADDDAFAAGLTCGGTLEVHIAPQQFVDVKKLAGTEKTASGSAGLANAAAGNGGGHKSAAADGKRAHMALLHRVDGPDGGTMAIADARHFGDRHFWDSHFRSQNPRNPYSRNPDAGDVHAGDLHAAGLHGDGRQPRSGSARLARLLGSGGKPAPASVVHRAMAQLVPMLRAGSTGLIRIPGPAGICDPDPITLLLETRLPAPRFLIFGANDFGAALLPAAKLLGYNVTLCDARAVFARQERFAAADQVVTVWPHRYIQTEAAAGRLDNRTVVCVLTHDPKFDVPLLVEALNLDLAYLGALGSRRSHENRTAALLEAGVDRDLLGALHSPIGLDIGALTPAEVAVSVTSEIIASRSGAAARWQLRHGHGSIHVRDTPPEIHTPYPADNGSHFVPA